MIILLFTYLISLPAVLHDRHIALAPRAAMGYRLAPPIFIRLARTRAFALIGDWALALPRFFQAAYASVISPDVRRHRRYFEAMLAIYKTILADIAAALPTRSYCLTSAIATIEAAAGEAHLLLHFEFTSSDASQFIPVFRFRLHESRPW